MDVQQKVMESGVVDRAMGLLSDHVLAIAGLALLGIGIGMATVGVVRLFLADDSDYPTDMWRARALLLKRLGAASAGLWTIGIEVVYLQAVGTAWLGTTFVALGAGIAAAGLNHPMFKPVKAVWRWALGKLRKKIEADGHSASDLDDTTFGRKP